ncbi:FecR family protein [Parapedobacter deserti]|uniref:FecR family protein n=1 Tax=Parapedobacter deserti TaxID=1912957 RepID=A0ABV7JK61_9SPHI
MKQRVGKKLLRRFLAGACTADEAAKVNHYLQQPAGRERLMALLDEQWDAVADHELPENVREIWRNELWSRLKADEGQQPETSQIKKLTRGGFFRYAAMWALLLLVGASAYLLVWAPKSHQPIAGMPEIEKENPHGRRSVFDLDDGTKVYLGAGSTVRFPKVFAGGRREIELEGEAFFEVSKDAEKPFIIHTGEIRTEVLGTSFMVKAFGEGEVAVAVATGKVRVDRFINGKRVQQLGVLTAGQKVVYNDAKQFVETLEIPVANLTQWKAGKMVFNGTPFGDMLDEMGRNYNISFILEKEQLKQIPITLTLDTHTPFEELLNSLSVYIGFSYDIHGKRIIIK